MSSEAIADSESETLKPLLHSTHYSFQNTSEPDPMAALGWARTTQVTLDPPSSMNMGWLRFVGSLQIKVSFAKEPYKRDYILQKRPIILRSLLIIATPYVDTCIHSYPP